MHTKYIEAINRKKMLMFTKYTFFKNLWCCFPGVTPVLSGSKLSIKLCLNSFLVVPFPGEAKTTQGPPQL